MNKSIIKTNETLGSTFRSRVFNIKLKTGEPRDLSADSFWAIVKNSTEVERIEAQVLPSGQITIPLTSLEITTVFTNYEIDYWADLAGLGREMLIREELRVSSNPNVQATAPLTFEVDFSESVFDIDLDYRVLQVQLGWEFLTPAQIQALKQPAIDAAITANAAAETAKEAAEIANQATQEAAEAAANADNAATSADQAAINADNAANDARYEAQEAQEATYTAKSVANLAAQKAVQADSAAQIAAEKAALAETATGNADEALKAANNAAAAANAAKAAADQAASNADAKATLAEEATTKANNAASAANAAKVAADAATVSASAAAAAANAAKETASQAAASATAAAAAANAVSGRTTDLEWVNKDLADFSIVGYFQASGGIQNNASYASTPRYRAKQGMKFKNPFMGTTSFRQTAFFDATGALNSTHFNEVENTAPANTHYVAFSRVATSSAAVRVQSDFWALQQDDLIAEYVHSSNRDIPITAMDIPTNTFTSPVHGLVNGDAVIIFPVLKAQEFESAAGNKLNSFLPIDGKIYSVTNITTDTFQIGTLTNRANLSLTSFKIEKVVMFRDLLISNVNVKNVRVVISGFVASGNYIYIGFNGKPYSHAGLDGNLACSTISGMFNNYLTSECRYLLTEVKISVGTEVTYFRSSRYYLTNGNAPITEEWRKAFLKDNPLITGINFSGSGYANAIANGFTIKIYKS